MRPVRTVIIEYDDGTSSVFTLPEGAGFYRERYTYEEDDKDKVVNRLDIFEIFWAVRSPVKKEGKSA
jgi:hypothetical protein